MTVPTLLRGVPVGVLCQSDGTPCFSASCSNNRNTMNCPVNNKLQTCSALFRTPLERLGVPRSEPLRNRDWRNTCQAVQASLAATPALCARRPGGSSHSRRDHAS